MPDNHRSLILIRWRSVKALVTPNHIQVVSKIKVLPVPRPKLVPPDWMAPTKIKIQAKRSKTKVTTRTLITLRSKEAKMLALQIN